MSGNTGITHCRPAVPLRLAHAMLAVDRAYNVAAWGRYLPNAATLYNRCQRDYSTDTGLLTHGPIRSEDSAEGGGDDEALPGGVA